LLGPVMPLPDPMFCGCASGGSLRGRQGYREVLLFLVQGGRRATPAVCTNFRVWIQPYWQVTRGCVGRLEGVS
jgi:hypothetical protein